MTEQRSLEGPGDLEEVKSQVLVLNSIFYLQCDLEQVPSPFGVSVLLSLKLGKDTSPKGMMRPNKVCISLFANLTCKMAGGVMQLHYPGTLTLNSASLL